MGFRVAEQHSNPVDGCHGGAMATFADMHLAALFGVDGIGGHNPTISLSVDYLAPAPVGAWVEAEISLVRKTRTLIFVQSLMTVDGDPVARSTAIYRNSQKAGS